LDWLLGALIIVASAALAQLLVGDLTNAAPWPLVWGVLVAGGAIAGLFLGTRGRTSWAFVRALLAPVVVILPLLPFSLLSNDEDEMRMFFESMAGLLMLWEVPLSLGYAVGHVRSRDMVLTGPQPVPFDPELDEATAGATIPLVVREYEDNDEGRRHLAADTDALAARGYEVVSVELVGPSIIADALAMITPFWDDWVELGATIVVTFRLRSARPA
jgi:hypothetical protein